MRLFVSARVHRRDRRSSRERKNCDCARTVQVFAGEDWSLRHHERHFHSVLHVCLIKSFIPLFFYFLCVQRGLGISRSQRSPGRDTHARSRDRRLSARSHQGRLLDEHGGGSPTDARLPPANRHHRIRWGQFGGEFQSRIGRLHHIRHRRSR